ncbi:MAG: hypothetical protein F6K11_09045 [Leptolyngbya sp. SIO3F4]|nr:hypothetical protein [Leptolyngbya sp. SIO3F4]
MTYMPRRIATFIFPVIIGVFTFITLVNPADAFAQGESDGSASAAMVAYCSGFKSQLAPYSAKEKALFLYHQNIAVEWEPDLSFQAGSTSSERLLAELERGAEVNNIRIVISRIVGELCGFAPEETSVAEMP